MHLADLLNYVSENIVKLVILHIDANCSEFGDYFLLDTFSLSKQALWLWIRLSTLHFGVVCKFNKG